MSPGFTAGRTAAGSPAGGCAGYGLRGSRRNDALLSGHGKIPPQPGPGANEGLPTKHRGTIARPFPSRGIGPIMLIFKRGHTHINQDDLSEYLDGRLSGTAAARIDLRLTECASCRRDLDALRSTVSLLQQMPELTLPRSFIMPGPPPAPVGILRRGSHSRIGFPHSGFRRRHRIAGPKAHRSAGSNGAGASGGARKLPTRRQGWRGSRHRDGRAPSPGCKRGNISGKGPQYRCDSRD